MIQCVKESTGTDVAAFDALVNMLTQLPAVLPEAAAVTPAVQQVPSLVATIDAARSDPDSLYLTTVTAGDLDNAIWPRDDADSPTTVDLQAAQSVRCNVAVDVDFSQNLSLWDQDSVSADDLLGSITMFESEQGQGLITKLALSQVEASAYYVTYHVD